jgi:hypothetical protein
MPMQEIQGHARSVSELLHEQKRAPSHQPVTKGFDPDVPMKDSGVERLGRFRRNGDWLGSAMRQALYE